MGDALSLVGCFVLFGLFVVAIVAGAAGLGLALRRVKNGFSGASGGRSSGAPSGRVRGEGGGWTGFGTSAEPPSRSTTD